MLDARSLPFSMVLVLLFAGGTVARSQDTPHEDLTPCSGSSPQPSKSAEWPVAFCNRTGHDIVIEFRDNDCPAVNWGRRGDVYRKSLRRGESATVALCYASELREAGGPKPGTPMLRIPGGKGVVTTWTVVGDCGDRSDHLYLDARTFYDRGDYGTGIILLQYPSGASHCVGGSPASAESQPRSAPNPPPREASASTPPPRAPAQQAVVAPPAPAQAAQAAPATPAAGGDKQPSLYAVVDDKNTLGRSVQVFARSEPGVMAGQCNFTLTLTFSDGGSWKDRTRADVPGGGAETPIATRKYFKTVSKADLSNIKCVPH
jgi:hypothetical protein